MSVYRPKNSRVWLYDFRWQGHRFHGSTGQRGKRAAEAVEARVRAEVALDTGKRARPLVTLDQIAGQYEDKLTAEERFSKNEERWLLALLTELGPKRYISDIEQHELVAFAAKRAGEVSAASVNREISLWRALWRFADRARFDIGEMPDWSGLTYATVDHDPREMSVDEEAAFFASVRADYAPFFRFLLLSGWRVSEVRRLRWSDVDMPRGIAVTTVKGRRRTNRPLTSDMVKLIGTQPVAGPFVFTYVCAKSRGDRREGERYPISQYGWRKIWAAAREAAELEPIRPHDLRHTRGTRILRATGNLVLAQRALAHRSIKSTMRYAHASDEDVRRGLDASESRTIPEVAASDAKKTA